MQYVWVILGLLFAFECVKHTEETPYCKKGQSYVIIETAEAAQKRRVYSLEATDEFIFLSDGQDGLISAFDWDGIYCFTIVTTADGNGSLELYSCNNKLIIIDKSSHIFVYKGDVLEEEYQIESLEQGSELRSVLREHNNHLVSLNGKKIVGKDSQIIMTVPNYWFRSNIFSILFTLISIILLFIKTRGRVNGTGDGPLSHPSP